MHADDGLLLPVDRLIAIVGNYGPVRRKSPSICRYASPGVAPTSKSPISTSSIPTSAAAKPLLMEANGIRVVVPPGAQAFADLPIVLPEIRGMLHPPAGTISIFDVGGDDVGARALAAFRTSIADGQYQLWQVINAKRPFTDTVAGCLAMRRAIESASCFSVTGCVNSHLIDETTPGVLDGWRLAQQVSCVGLADSPRSDHGRTR